MIRSLTYIFPAGNISDVCRTQNIAAAGNLILNGNLADSTWSQVPFLLHGYSRSISFTSANDLSAARFTITGFQNGVLVVENNITGPNADTVYANQIFDTIVSISVNQAVNGISVGTGHSGFFSLIEINLEKDVINYSFNTARLTAFSIDTTIFASIQNIFNNGKTFADNAANNWNVFLIKESSVDNSYIFPKDGAINEPLYRCYLIQISGDPTTIANSIQMNFIQT